MMSSKDLSILPLHSAQYCPGCDYLSNATGVLCPVCGSPSLYPIQRMLDKDPVETAVMCDA